MVTMSKKKQVDAVVPALVASDVSAIDEARIFECVSEIIENRKFRAGAYADRENMLMYWEIRRYVNSIILDSKRAEYGRKTVSELAT
jgi:hypothetical protein